MVKVGINGFGRIGRIAFKVGISKHASELEFSAINTSGSMEAPAWTHLVNYDTAYGKFLKQLQNQAPLRLQEVGIRKLP